MKLSDTVFIQQGDCLELMKKIPDKHIDMILCDLPYGTTDCKWDTVIPFEPLWEQYERVIKPNGCVALFGSEPFSTYLRMSNIKNYKYDLIWEKHKPSNFALANKQPMKYHENISIFYKKQPTYNPQMIKRDSERIQQGQNVDYVGVSINHGELNSLKTVKRSFHKYSATEKLPSSILKFNAVQSNSKEKLPHPTQKPVALMEYLIKTYTQENEIVLDNTMGVASTGVACVNLNRKFIGYELDEKYFEIGKNRLIAQIETHI